MWLTIKTPWPRCPDGTARRQDCSRHNPQIPPPPSSLQIQPPIASFVHPKLPLAARLGHCWGARSSRLPFSASRPPKAPEGWRTPRRFARFVGQRPTRQRHGVRWPSTAFSPRMKPSYNFKHPLPRSSTPNCPWVLADGHHGARPPTGTWLGSAPVPMAVSTVSNSKG